jgi:hypothetical protein
MIQRRQYNLNDLENGTHEARTQSDAEQSASLVVESLR